MNRSEKLAKLLGVEPKKQEISNGVEFTGKYIEIYPDFEKPENFMKLQLLQLRFGALPFLSGYMFTLNTFIDAILYEVKETLLDDRNKFIEEYKQQAQQTEWEY